MFINRPTYAEVGYYAAAPQNGLWLNVLEKAYGIVRNDRRWFYRTSEPFDATVKGRLDTSTKDLTNHGVTTHGVKSNAAYQPNAIKVDIANALARTKLVTAGSLAEWPWTRKNLADLPRSHAYTIIAYDPNLEPGQGGTLTIRNPWGQEGVPGHPYKGTFMMTVAQFKIKFAVLVFEN